MILLTSTSDCNRRKPKQLIACLSVRGGGYAARALHDDQQCDYVLSLQDIEEGRAIETPNECPLCRSEVVSACPSCGFPLLGLRGSFTCQVCATNMKAFFAQSQPDA